MQASVLLGESVRRIFASPANFASLGQGLNSLDRTEATARDRLPAWRAARVDPMRALHHPQRFDTDMRRLRANQRLRKTL